LVSRKFRNKFAPDAPFCQPQFVVRCNPGADEERKCPQYYDRRSLPLRSDAGHVSVTAEGEDELRGMANISTNAAASQHGPSSHAHEYSVLQYLHRETRQRPAHSVRHSRAPQAHGVRHSRAPRHAPDAEVNAPAVIPAAGDSEHLKKNQKPHSAPSRGVRQGARKRHAKRALHSRAPQDAPDAGAHAPAVNPAAGDSDHHNKDKQSHSALSGRVAQEARQRHAKRARHSRAPKARDAPDAGANAPAVIPAAGDSDNKAKQSHSALSGRVAQEARQRHAKRVRHSRAPKARDAPDAGANAPAVIPAAGGSDHHNKDKQSHSAPSHEVGQGARKSHAKRARHSRAPKPRHAQHVQPNAPDDSKHPTQDKQPQAHLRFHGDPEWQVCAPVNTDQCCIWSMAFPGTATEWLQQ